MARVIDILHAELRLTMEQMGAPMAKEISIFRLVRVEEGPMLASGRDKP